MASDKSYGNNGVFEIMSSYNKNRVLTIIASDGLGWDHISVHVEDLISHKERTPLWEEMCYVKDLFWDEEDVVVQYHPAKSSYINQHPNTLHLWMNQAVSFMTPPIEMV